MKPIVVTETDGVIKMTKEEFQKYIDETYWEGYCDGKKECKHETYSCNRNRWCY